MKYAENVKPIRKNQKVELDITSLGSDGQGVGRADGFVVFVPFALPGERVEALVIKVASGYAVGKLLRVLSPSVDRIEPRCSVFRRCGGCQLQHMQYPAQLAFKRGLVADALRSIGGIAEPNVLPVIGMVDPWRYRNKGAFPIAMRDGAVVTGMFAARSHDVVAVADCPLQPALMGSVIAAVREWASMHGITAYDERTGSGLLRHVMVRSFAETGETLAIIVTNGEALPATEDLVASLRVSVPGLAGVIQSINTENTNVVLGTRHKVLWGGGYARAELAGLGYSVGHRSFFQVNSDMTELLYKAAADLACLQGGELVVDAYCGVGTVGQALAGRAGRVIGIESVPESVAEARLNARRNGISNVEYVCGRAEEVLPELVRQGLRPEVIVTDPPRKGCDPRFLKAAASTKASRIVYISCNPATLARDVRFLSEHGYRLDAAQPVDMFPQTADVECVALMSRVDA